MNKDEIKKAFDICCDAQTQSCTGCPILELEKRNGRGCKYNMFISVFDLITEQEKEIERLKSEFKQLETNAEILASGVRDLNHENYELTEKVKQVQIDVLNKLKDSYGLYYLSAFGVKERMLADILNPMIEELKK